jgi:hypothetical protein
MNNTVGKNPVPFKNMKGTVLNHMRIAYVGGLRAENCDICVRPALVSVRPALVSVRPALVRTGALHMSPATPSPPLL